MQTLSPITLYTIHIDTGTEYSQLINATLSTMSIDIVKSISLTLFGEVDPSDYSLYETIRHVQGIIQ